MSPAGPTIDSHAHLYFESFDEDRDEVLARAREAGFRAVINVGIDVATSRAAVELALAHAGFCFATAGLHPNESSMSQDELQATLAEIEALLDAHPREVRAIGEIGLDYYRDHAAPEAQARSFREQLEMARRRNLPVVIHCREAMDDTLAMVEEHGDVRGVFHCFGGDAGHARRALDLGWFVSFAGNVTFPKAESLREAARVVPPERLLLETDAPFLAPQPVRGKRNEPAFALHTLSALAGILELDVDELAAHTTRNAEELFGL